MRCRELVYLLNYENMPNSISDEGVKVATVTPVYANRFVLSSAKQLRAQIEGLRIRGRVEIWTFEYDGQNDIQVNGETYSILSVEERGDKTLITYGQRIGS